MQFVFHFFKGDAFGFRDEKEDPQQLENHHSAEKAENHLGLQGTCHNRKEEGDDSRKKPVGKASEGLSCRPLPVGEDLTDKHPDDGALAYGMSGNEGEDADRDNGEPSGSKGPGGKTQGEDVAEGSEQ